MATPRNRAHRPRLRVSLSALDVFSVVFGITTIVWVNDLFGGPREGPNAPLSIGVMVILVSLYVLMSLAWSRHPEEAGGPLPENFRLKHSALTSGFTGAITLLFILVILYWTRTSFPQYEGSSFAIGGSMVVWWIFAVLLHHYASQPQARPGGGTNG